jgi:hypothetical protein
MFAQYRVSATSLGLTSSHRREMASTFHTGSAEVCRMPSARSTPMRRSQLGTSPRLPARQLAPLDPGVVRALATWVSGLLDIVSAGRRGGAPLQRPAWGDDPPEPAGELTCRTAPTMLMRFLQTLNLRKEAAAS